MNWKTGSVCLIFMGVSFVSDAQNCQYYKTLREASIQKADSNYTWAGQLYEEALEMTQTPVSSNYRALAHIYIFNGEFQRAAEQLRGLIALGSELDELESEFWVYDQFSKSADWEKLKNDYPDLRDQFFSGKEVDLLIRMERMSSKFVTYNTRSNVHLSDSVWLLGRDRILAEVLSDLRFIVHKWGWPNHLKVGDKYANSAIRILYLAVSNQRNDESDWSFFEPVLKEQVDLGLVNPYSYATITDKFLSVNKGFQRYGTLGAEEVQLEVDDLTITNRLRALFCLSPLP